MKVASVLLNFRRAILVLVPSMEFVAIPWKRPDAYDEWDEIATMLFSRLVIGVIQWSLPDDDQIDFCMPAYDLLAESYEGQSTLEVSHPILPQGRWVFHAFGTTSEPFDTVEVREVSMQGLPVADNFVTCPLAGADFRFRLCHGSDGDRRILEEIRVR